MSVTTLIRFLSRASIEQIAEKMRNDLDTPSPHMGAKGSPKKSGPEARYKVALEQSSKRTKEKAGNAVNMLLLELAGKLSGSGRVERPQLLFNLLLLLIFQPLAQAVPGLAALKEIKEPLQQALADRDEDLYGKLLRASAFLLPSSEHVGFWKKILNAAEREYVWTAVSALRESGLETACETLPLIMDVYERRRELGDPSEVVELLVLAHPEGNWPKCATENIDFSLLAPLAKERLCGLLHSSADLAYQLPLEEIKAERGTAAADLLARAKRMGKELHQKINEDLNNAMENAPTSLLTYRALAA